MTVRLLPLLLLALLAGPATAEAHSLFGEFDPDRPVIEYLSLGFTHMVGGWDHLLFIAGVVVLAGDWRRAAKLVSVFVAGHSLTLLVATIAGWKISATAVDVVIALSLVYVGVQGLRGRPENLRTFAAIVFAFGLVHGLGLSTRLQALGLPEDGVVGRVILFNVGVELGQLVALAVIVGLGTLLLRAVRDRAKAARLAFGTLAAAGLVAAAILSFPGADAEPVKQEAVAEQGSAAAGGTGACKREDVPAPQAFGGDHPDKLFYGPDEKAPEEDLSHVVGDGLVIVRYSPGLPAEQVDRIEAFVGDGASSQYVIAAADPDQEEPLKALVAQRTLTCTEVDIDGLTAFRDEWFAFVRAQQGG